MKAGTSTKPTNSERTRGKKASAQKTQSSFRDLGWVNWIQNHSLALFLLLVGIASVRIVATYHVFSETADEPTHIASGIQWLSKGIYQLEPNNPPLPRLAAAAGPYIFGSRSQNVPEWWAEGLAVLNRDGHHDRTLTLARLGILPFFWAACFIVYVWGKRYLGEPETFFALLSFTFLPPILAHAGLATTDMALTAMVGASFLTGLTWTEKPTWLNSVLFGVTTGLAVLSKFTALAFIPISFAAAGLWVLLTGRVRFSELRALSKTHLLRFCVAVFIGFIVIWGGYRFSFGQVPFSSLRLPAWEMYVGIRQTMDLARNGHAGYLLGESRQFGWWYYYLVALLFKTPLPFSALVMCAVLLRKRNDAKQGDAGLGTGLAFAFSLGILLFSLTSDINVGIRYILPVYIGFSLAAGVGAVRLLQRSRKSQFASWSLGVLFVWLIGASVLSHPDYLSYFNALALGEPERILVDSDLDWGQDLKRLSKRLHEAGAAEVAFDPFFRVDLAALGFPAVRNMNPLQPAPGWNAVSLTTWKAERFGYFNDRMDLQFWPDRIKPTEKIGNGIWLWYFPPNGVPKN